MRVSGDRALKYLAAYDDPSLPARRRRRLDVLLERSPSARRELERQRAVRSILVGFAAEAPASLRLEMERIGRRPPVRRPALRPVLGWAAGSACLLALLLVAFSLSDRLGASDTLATAVAGLAHARAAEPAPALMPGRQDVLQRGFEGVEFPSWSAEFGWHATGARADVVEGRATSTVFYEHRGHRLAYTVVAGAPLDPPDGARQVRVHGFDVHVYADGDHTVTMFERGGRTCMLAGHVLHASTAIELATWRGSDALRF